MTKDKLLHIINQGKNEILEFKTSFNKAAIENYYCIFKHKGKGRGNSNWSKR
jgi:hypothetical protein